MAKPIRATPELKGQDAENFVKKMILIEKRKISKIDENFAKQIEMNSKLFQMCPNIQVS